MDQYSILLDKQPYQAGTKTVPSSPEAKTEFVSAAGATREGLQFPGEDGGRSLSHMAQRDLDATLQLLVERAQYITGASGAAIALHEGEAMICCASAGPSAPQPGTQLQAESGLSAESVRTRKTLRCDDAESDPRVNRESCRSFGIASVVVMPLVRDEKVYGVFELLSGRPRAFGDRDLVALERLGEMIQTAVDHAEAARRTEQELSQPLPDAAAANAEPDVVNHPANPPMPKVAAYSDDPAPTPEAATHEVPTNPVPPPTPAPGLASNALLLEMLEPPAGQNQTLTESGTPDPVTPIQFGNVGKCSACGFPVSSGRKLCLDCEAASPRPDPEDTQPPDVFGQFADPDVGWIRSHLFLLGALAVAAATMAVLVWRF